MALSSALGNAQGARRSNYFHTPDEDRACCRAPDTSSRRVLTSGVSRASKHQRCTMCTLLATLFVRAQTSDLAAVKWSTLEDMAAAGTDGDYLIHAAGIQHPLEQSCSTDTSTHLSDGGDGS